MPVAHGFSKKVGCAVARPFRFWGTALLIVFFGLLLRIILSGGIDGSDGLNYNLHAHRLSTGDVTPLRHVTSIRYPLIVPMALSMRIFGVNEAASLLPVFGYGLLQ